MDAERTLGARTVRVARVTWRALLAAVSAAVLAVTGYAWSATTVLAGRIATSDVRLSGTAATGSDAAFTALLVGLDSRTDNAGNPLPPDVLAQLHAGDDEGQLNTDTIILLHVPSGPRPRAVAISFPRDSYVEIAGDHGIHKINSAFRRGRADAEAALTRRDLPAAERERRAGDGGRNALVSTVQELAGVTIDRFAEINLAGFLEITDALGGVPVCLNSAVRESRSGIDLPAGRQVVSGADAVAFVRQRHGLDGGDLDRISRQQAFLAGMTSTVTTSGLLSEPSRLSRLTDALVRYVVLDRDWTADDLVGQLRRVAAGELSFVTIPTGDPALRTPADGVAVEVEPQQVRRFVRGLLSDRPWAASGTSGDAAPPTTSTTASANRSAAAVIGVTGRGPDPTTATARPAGAAPTTAPATAATGRPATIGTGRPTTGTGSTATRTDRRPTSTAPDEPDPTTTRAAPRPPATTTPPPISDDDVPCVD